MRIVLVDPLSYSAPYDHHLAEALARRGHDVSLLTSRFLFDDVPVPGGYRREELLLPLSGRLLRRAPRSRLRVLLKALEYGPSLVRLLRRIDALDPDVVHVQWLPQPRLDVRWLRRVARDRATVFTAHNALPRNPRFIPARREALAIVDRIVVHSRTTVDELERLGVDRERIARIPHAVFGPAEGYEPVLPAGSTLLFFGLLRDYKGLEELVAALPAIAREAPEARLVVAGDPFDPVEPARRLAVELGVDGRIDWRLGFLPDGRIPELMAEAAAVVLPYRRIDSSGVLATAIGHGLPVVVTDVGALGEPVREFGAGIVVPPGDVPALAAACARLLTDPAAREEAFRGALAARGALSWNAAAEAHERLYRGIVAA
jgi:glycosyltransferase involved in cell wall biosynthesis